jgi:hypothetical protein
MRPITQKELQIINKWAPPLYFVLNDFNAQRLWEIVCELNWAVSHGNLSQIAKKYPDRFQWDKPSAAVKPAGKEASVWDKLANVGVAQETGRASAADRKADSERIDRETAQRKQTAINRENAEARKKAEVDIAAFQVITNGRVNWAQTHSERKKLMDVLNSEGPEAAAAVLKNL